LGACGGTLIVRAGEQRLPKNTLIFELLRAFDPMADGLGTPRLLNGRRSTLTAQALGAAAAEKRAARLACELASAKEELAHQENRILSLQNSLDLQHLENVWLRSQLAERSAALELAREECELSARALAAAKAQVAEKLKEHRSTISTLHGDLQNMSTRAVRRQDLLVDAKRSLTEIRHEKSALQQDLEEVKSRLVLKDGEIQDLKVQVVQAGQKIGKLSSLFSQLQDAASDKFTNAGPEVPVSQLKLGRKNQWTGKAATRGASEWDLQDDGLLF
jgi:chromosome segregation ATPase